MFCPGGERIGCPPLPIAGGIDTAGCMQEWKDIVESDANHLMREGGLKEMSAAAR